MNPNESATVFLQLMYKDGTYTLTIEDDFKGITHMPYTFTDPHAAT